MDMILVKRIHIKRRPLSLGPYLSEILVLHKVFQQKYPSFLESTFSVVASEEGIEKSSSNTWIWNLKRLNWSFQWMSPSVFRMIPKPSPLPKYKVPIELISSWITCVYPDIIWSLKTLLGIIINEKKEYVNETLTCIVINKVTSKNFIIKFFPAKW